MSVTDDPRETIWATVRLPVPIPVLVDVMRPLVDEAAKVNRTLYTRQNGQFLEIYDNE